MNDRPPNLLFIMADQLRWDYLSCVRPDRVATPNIDRLAGRGVRFDRAYVQSPICGPSRMSFYTGTYMRTHGSTWNDVPLRVDEWTLGDYLRPLGVRTQLVGKTHMRADLAGMRRLGIDPSSGPGKLAAECGFEAFERDDGLYPEPPGVPSSRFAAVRYNQYLNGLGYDGVNPWHAWANSWEDVDGNVRSGWLLDAGPHPARVAAEHSETPYMTQRAMECIAQSGDAPWCIHLSYIKPHWPYIAPAPYHARYIASDVPPAVGSPNDGPRSGHPVYDAFRQLPYSRAFSRDEVRRAVIPAYMGLISQIDDELGRLFAWLDERGLTEHTVIVFTSDHGDYLGDHRLGEKEFFHEPSVRIPLIIADPRPGADTTRGTVCDALVEAIDVLPTFIELAGGKPSSERLEGHSLVPLLHGGIWRERETAFSEFDYAMTRVRTLLATPVDRSKMRMAVSEGWKLMQFDDFPSLLFNLGEDPDELVDRSSDLGAAGVRADLEGQIDEWARRIRRPTESVKSIEQRTDTQMERGILLGIYDRAELAKESSHGANI